jgi:hypothetical protein
MGNTVGQKLKLAIMTYDSKDKAYRHSVVWEGELEIKPDNEYLMKVSMLVEGKPEPLCDIPFAPGIGHYMWVPGSPELLPEVETGALTWHFTEGS